MNKPRKILLSKETLRELEGREVVGGVLPNTQFNSCRCPTLSCQHVGFC